MSKEASLEKIEKEIGNLTSQEQLNLIERLIHRLRRKRIPVRKELDWSKLYGLGKGLWKNQDAQDYVNHLRKNRT